MRILRVCVIAGATLALGLFAYTLAYRANYVEPVATPKSDIVMSDSNTKEMILLEKQYSGIRGEAFDKKYLEDMIEHYKSAVDMANLTVSQAKRLEIATLGGQIVTTQEQVVEYMKGLQKSWGYQSSMSATMMEHSTMGMTAVSKAFAGKTGDDFDRTFLDLMIKHHQSAIAMSRAASTNAKHQEVKSIAQKTIITHSLEVAKMQQWRASWFPLQNTR